MKSFSGMRECHGFESQFSSDDLNAPLQGEKNNARKNKLAILRMALAQFPIDDRFQSIVIMGKNVVEECQRIFIPSYHRKKKKKKIRKTSRCNCFNKGISCCFSLELR